MHTFTSTVLAELRPEDDHKRRRNVLTYCGGVMRQGYGNSMRERIHRRACWREHRALPGLSASPQLKVTLIFRLRRGIARLTLEMTSIWQGSWSQLLLESFFS